ncbi:hypothetical protein SCOR_13165 [Sulfidibacter corallicola]
MFMCFESDGKRSAFPEASLICLDDNGFTFHSAGGSRTGSNSVFFRMDSFQGACQNFQQALNWVRRKQPQQGQQRQAQPPSAGADRLPSQPKF